jgi:nitrous oxide reductase accessory protein NosL
MRRNWIISTISMAVVIAAFFMLQSCNRTAQCPLCNREIHQHMGVKITHNGFPLKTCCMACALTYHHEVKNVEITAATDFVTNSPIDPKKAFYVVGSDISPCTQDVKVKKFIREPHDTLYACYDRCEPGILAFSKKADAETFQQTHGGRVKLFDQLLHQMG